MVIILGMKHPVSWQESQRSKTVKGSAPNTLQTLVSVEFLPSHGCLLLLSALIPHSSLLPKFSTFS